MKRMSVFTICAFAFLAAFTVLSATSQAQDLTLKGPIPYLINGTISPASTTAGDQAEGDVKVTGTALDYTGVLLNVGAGSTNLFLKVQNQDADNLFEYGACYTGNNSGSFGLGFFALSTPFNNAHMQAVRSGNTVTINFTNVDGGSKANQQYVCSNAPAAEGSSIGVHGYGGVSATIDNFSAGAGVLDTFSYNGPLSGTGNWTNIEAGMVANGTAALATSGVMARALWSGAAPQACTLGLNLTWTGVLNANFTLGASQPTRFNMWLVFMDYSVQLINAVALPAITPAVNLPIPLGIPSVANVGILGTMVTSEGVVCSAWKTVYTGPFVP